MQTDLKKIYEKWSDEVISNCPSLIEGAYSNPYYVSIPNNWEISQQRIMIVGEEGNGSWGCGKSYGWTEQEPAYTIKSIEKIQYYNTWAIEKYPQQNKSPFWRRFKKIMDFGYPCIWNNLDKIYSFDTSRKEKGKKLNYQLTTAEEIQLHSVPTKILHEEITTLKPTVVVFFGWYPKSLRLELPQIYDELYSHQSEWSKTALWHFVSENIIYIFTYHPSWGNRQKGYELKVADYIINSITSQ